jgi:hypothetical protein
LPARCVGSRPRSRHARAARVESSIEGPNAFDQTMTTRAMRSIATRAIDDRDERPTAVH